MISRERACEVFEARLRETGDIAEALIAVAREGAAAMENHIDLARARSPHPIRKPSLSATPPSRPTSSARLFAEVDAVVADVMRSSSPLGTPGQVVQRMREYLARGVSYAEMGRAFGVAASTAWLRLAPEEAGRYLLMRSTMTVTRRWVAMLVMRRMGLDLTEIGRAMWRDRTTVRHGLERAAQRPDVVAMAEQVLARLERGAGERRAA